MPTKKNSQSKKTTKPRDNNGRYVAPEDAVVSRLGASKEEVTTTPKEDVTTRHGSTIHYS